ncbi:hypothetical protein PR048_008728 [Dryococelus australis]|uniref:DDE-1 domain-containing protein n=1 Tax=Dryococelus australis TaxID=614101 RepID=A0ABQ9HXX7_9NEOP|nr:hypothetical protein PR048_008728 [Dryococelus australis]
MDQDILETLKRNYRRKLLSTMIEEEIGGHDMIEKLKRINVKDVAYWVPMAWADVRARTIAKLWMKLLADDESMETQITDETEETFLTLVQRIPGCESASLLEIKSWMKDDDRYEITDEEIIALVNCDNEI